MEQYQDDPNMMRDLQEQVEALNIDSDHGLEILESLIFAENVDVRDKAL